MGSLFSSTKNTRFLPDNSLKYIRSDVPNHLTEEEIQWLWDNNVHIIMDLRMPEESEQKPCPIADRSEFNYYNFPVTGGNIVPNKPNHVSISYLNMVDDAMWKIIEFIETSTTNVLYFCNAGKDRTGIVSALLLSRMNVDKEKIINDYLQSADNLKTMLQNFASQNSSVDINVITPHSSYMEEFLDNYTKLA